MALNYDLYLYFDPEDNVAKNPGEYGWAENFKRFLSIMLRQFLGRHPVFLETDLEKEADILEEVKALIFILSPASVKSPALQHILTGFKQISTRQKDIEFTNRIFKIVKFPVPLGDQPEEVRAQLPFDLYDYDPASGKTKEIENFFSQEAEMNYWMKLVDLAFDINSTLSHFEKHEHINEHVTPKRSVFLAETGPELIVQRNMIKRELLRQGYQVHPDRNLSTEAKALSEEVKDILGNCNYSIHLMGDHVAVGNEVSISEVQNTVVSNYLKRNPDNKAEGFSRLIWLSPNFKVKDERQQTFLENMRRDLEEVGHTEIFQTPFEDFKFVLKNALIDVSDFNLKINAAKMNHNGKSIYLIYDKIDREDAEKLAAYLKRKDIQVMEPLFEGNLMDIRQMHIQNLTDFDGVMIFAGKVNEFWVKMKLLDILKSPGFGRLKPLTHKCIFIEPGSLVNREGFTNYEVTVSEGEKGNFNNLDAFINNLE